MTATNTKKVHRLRIKCVSGPWLDAECVRFIDVPENANLYDLHVAIQDAVAFDDEYPFYFFKALAPEGSQDMIPPDMDPEDEESIDDDVYEDIQVLSEIKPNARKHTFYGFKSDVDDWIFQIDHTGEIMDADPRVFYPAAYDALSIGPNPEQYGSGFDDYSTNENDFVPQARRSFGADEYTPDDEQDDDDFFGGPDRGGDGFFDDEDEDENDDFLDEDEDDFWRR